MTPQWRKSSRSDGVNDQACVEVAGLLSGVDRADDSANPETVRGVTARTEPARRHTPLPTS